jgi:ABC-type transport system involved in multi-copper enzyme maturation permease subunit
MIRQVVLTDLRVRMRSAGVVVAFLLLLAAVTVAILVCFRTLGQQPAPNVNYGGVGFSGFGRSAVAADTTGALRPALTTLTSASRGMVVLVVLAGVLAVGGGLIGAILGAGAIAGEYERETLDLVLTTQLGVGGMTAAKLLTTFLYALLLALSMLPAFGFLFVFSNVPLNNLIVAAAVVAGSLLCGSAIGIFCSATLRSSVAAFFSAGALCTTLFVGGAACYYLLTQLTGPLPVLVQLLLLPSPIAALLSSAAEQLQGSTTVLLPALLHASPDHPVHIIGRWQSPLPLWTLTLALDIVLTAVLAAFSAHSLRRMRPLA